MSLPGDVLRFEVPLESDGERLDAYLAKAYVGASRSALARFIRDGHVTVGGRVPRKAGHAVGRGDIVDVRVPSGQPTALKAESRDLRIVYEDIDILVVDKPTGLAVHPGAGRLQGTLVNALLGRGGPLATAGDPERPGIVHRLDKETSGLMLVAKTDSAYRALIQQFKDREVSKTYLALVHGNVGPKTGSIEAPLGRDPHRRQRMAVVDGGRPAVTDYRVVAPLERHTLIEAYPRTGRTHQLRVHLTSIGHPVVGDGVYGRRSDTSRLFLHAYRLRLTHPATGAAVAFRSPLPDDLAEVLGRYGGAKVMGVLAEVTAAAIE